MVADENLIREVLSLADGSNIHRIKNEIGCYRNAIYLVKRGFQKWTEQIQISENKLRAEKTKMILLKAIFDLTIF